MKIIKAIQKINPSAIVTVIGSDIDTCEIIWQENTTPISKEDIKAMLSSVEQDLIDKETKKASGKQKLLDLGLTEEEVKALIGI